MGEKDLLKLAVKEKSVLLDIIVCGKNLSFQYFCHVFSSFVLFCLLILTLSKIKHRTGIVVLSSLLFLANQMHPKVVKFIDPS